MKEKDSIWMAKDGRLYDIVNPSVDRPLKSYEVEIIQLMRPEILEYIGGERRKLVAELDEETARKADDLIVIATLDFGNNAIICARFIGEHPDTQICMNNPNDVINPDIGNRILTELINEITKRGRV